MVRYHKVCMSALLVSQYYSVFIQHYHVFLMLYGCGYVFV